MKAILVIDTEDEELIGELVSHYGESSKYIHLYDKWYKCITKLKPLPERKDVEKIRNLHSNGQGNCAIGCAIGYNACIDDILGEENETVS